MTIIRGLLIAGLFTTLVAISGCSGLDFGDHPGKDVAKQAGPLTTPPEHLKIGNSE